MVAYLSDWEQIAGTVQSIDIDDDGVEIVTTDGRWRFVAEGDCCAHAYVHEPTTANEEARALIGQRIVNATATDGERVGVRDYGDVRDIHFYTLQGDRSALTLTLYVDHNGYYGGWLQLVGR